MQLIKCLGTLSIYHGICSASTVTIDPKSQLQVIDGFGISQAFGRASQFKALAQGPQQKGLDYLFNTTTGAGLSIIRNRIGSGSNSADSIEPNSPGSPNAKPTYIWDGDDEGQVWFSQEAMGYGYLHYYNQTGIPITHVGFLNEPDGSDFMLSDAAQAASMIPILHSTLEIEGFGHVKMTCCDNIGWNSQKAYTKNLTKAGMDEYLSVITSHMYSSDATTPMDTNLTTWITEAADLTNPWCTTWYSTGSLCEGFTWAVKLAEGIVNAGLSAYLYWEGVEVSQQQAASYLVLSDGTDVYPSGRLWAMAHWSRYIRPGAHRVATTGTVPNTIIGAFVNTDSSLVTVLTNSGGIAQNVELDLPGASSDNVFAVVTDQSSQMAPLDMNVSNGIVSVSVPAYGVITVKSEGTVAGGSSNIASPSKINIATPSSTAISSSSSVSRARSSSAIPSSSRAVSKSAQNSSAMPGKVQASTASACEAPIPSQVHHNHHGHHSHH
ncbi:conserved hypothetical protein [Talaromyces stipitatus ATCC 10500]|uniref:Glycosyl hydrolase family 30 beta sandwich domain-containing protein n=1 Tax=Talaromyces stipitatus (strain ATCC 10500 / CBS 375.48 / QM 6759 / NRRL 1006) TaxID=441959 RepID=B8M9H3_TALSN|nr:uncharacterized protein TSTA_115320 [Talaromyces stipitatus ATCC 10500]EED17733.1 conserved hypothetical protein [Talaromyces stipitatus ATCC 10500]